MLACVAKPTRQPSRSPPAAVVTMNIGYSKSPTMASNVSDSVRKGAHDGGRGRERQDEGVRRQPAPAVSPAAGVLGRLQKRLLRIAATIPNVGSTRMRIRPITEASR